MEVRDVPVGEKAQGEHYGIRTWIDQYSTGRMMAHEIGHNWGFRGELRGIHTHSTSRSTHTISHYKTHEIFHPKTLYYIYQMLAFLILKTPSVTSIFHMKKLHWQRCDHRLLFYQ